MISIKAGLVAAGLVLMTGSHSSPTIDDVKWIAGCWELNAGDRTTEEQWMAPKGGIMLGMSRTVRGGKLVEFEQVRMEMRADGLFYVASPSRQATAEFKATAATESSSTFENPAHDFPTKISYRKQGTDSLVASIAGERGGQTRTIEYPYRRVVCP